MKVKLGCLNQTEFFKENGIPKRKGEYHLQPLEIVRPDHGITFQKVTCECCGKDLILRVKSASTVLRKRLGSFILALTPLLPYWSAKIFQPEMDSFLSGFLLALMLLLAWTLPVFLPIVFLEDYKLAVNILNPDSNHCLFEPNVHSVQSQFYH